MRKPLLFFTFSCFVFSAGGLVAQPPAVFLTSEDFEAALEGGHRTENFSGLRDAGETWSETGGRMHTSSYGFPNEFSFTASVDAGELTFLRDAVIEQHGWEGDGLGARDAGETFTILPDPGDGVSGLGGYFFPFHHDAQEGQDRGGGFAAGGVLELTFAFQDGTQHVHVHAPANHDQSFYGVTSSVDNPITSLAVVMAEGDFHAGTSEVTAGAIPEPRIAAFITGLAAIGLVIIFRGRRV